MALINCPECAHNTSDTTDRCPNCGYSIRQYLEEKKQKELLIQKEQERNERIRIEKQKLQPELEAKLREIDATPCLTMPPVIWWIKEVLVSLLLAAISIGVIWFSVWAGGIALVVLGGGGLLFLILSIWALFVGAGKSTDAYTQK